MCYIRRDHCDKEEECSDITDPCDCVENCGWSSETGTCEPSTDANTNCSECTTMDGCTEGSCENCEGAYDEMKTCQCTPDCKDYGNCCETCDHDPCAEVTDMTDPCACVEGCGFSSTDGSCKVGSDTHCYECTTLDACMPGECGESCTAAYNPMTTCQCTPDCEEYGNCCPECQPEDDCTESCDKCFHEDELMAWADSLLENIKQDMRDTMAESCQKDCARADQCERDFELQQHNFKECAAKGEIEEGATCTDLEWHDIMGSDC
eukprot:UN27314